MVLWGSDSYFSSVRLFSLILRLFVLIPRGFLSVGPSNPGFLKQGLHSDETRLLVTFMTMFVLSLQPLVRFHKTKVPFNDTLQRHLFLIQNHPFLSRVKRFYKGISFRIYRLEPQERICVIHIRLYIGNANVFYNLSWIYICFFNSL